MDFDDKRTDYNSIIINKKIINDNTNIKLIKTNNYSDLILNKYNDSYNQLNTLKELSKKDNNFLYLLNLFLQFSEALNVDIKAVIKYIVDYNIDDLNMLLQSNGDFTKWLKALKKLSDYYTYHLSKIINLKSNDIFEINKGQFDSAVSENNILISKYANTFYLDNSIIRNRDGKLYIYDFDKDEEELVPEGSTFLMHNVYSDSDFIYNINALAGTNNRLVIGNWGFENDFIKSKFSGIIKTLKLLYNGEINVIDSVKNGVYCCSIILDTKKIKKLFDDDTLFEKELSIYPRVKTIGGDHHE